MNIITASLKDFKKAWRLYLSFALVYLLLASYLFVPFLGYIFNRILLLTDSNVLINSEIFRVLLNYRSALGLLVFVLVVIFFIVIEQASLIIVSNRQYLKKEIHLSEAIIIALKNFHKMIIFGVFYIVFAGIIIFPVLDFSFVSPVFDAISVPAIITENIFSLWTLRIVYILIFVFFLYLFLKWIFVMHEILLGGKRAFSAIKSSMKLTKKVKISKVIKMALLNIFLFLLIPGPILISLFLLNFFEVSTHYFISQNLVLLAGFMIWVYSLAVVPINTIFITRLYYSLIHNSSDESFSKKEITKITRINKFEDKIKALSKKHKVKSAVIVLISLSIVYFTSALLGQSIMHFGRDVKIIVHRAGYEKAPENSLSAISLSLENGADMIEVDVQLTLDNIPVLHHDRTLRKMAGISSRVEDLTFDELKQIEIGQNRYPDIVDETIPSLEEALELIDNNANLLIDVKVFDNREVLAQSIVEAIHNANSQDYVYIQSFDYKFLEIIRELDNNIPIGQIMYYALGNLSELDVDFYTIHKGMLDRNFILDAQKENRRIFVWTLNSKEEIQNALLYDIDGIITSNLPLAQRVLGVFLDDLEFKVSR